jgi:crotonobetainyl-CoA:carnitine CoA-transferase CaiB-like acyl-CoA transferase
MPGPLAGIQVLDLTTILMGPLATQVLGDLGADIIKVEPLTGDMSRHIGIGRNSGMAALFLNNNRNKRSIAIDLKRPEGRHVMMQLARSSDVFVSNVRSGGLRRLGLDYETICKANPNLIYVSMVGYGSGGRYANMPAYDDLIQAASGIAALNGRATGGEPRFVPLALADRMVGLTGANVMLAALLHRARTGQGQEIEVPMFETMVQFVLGDHLNGATFEPEMGPTGYPRLLSPYRKPFATKDGFIAVLPYNDAHWQKFFEASGTADLLSNDPRFSDIGARTKHIDELYAIAANIISEKNTEEWFDILRRADVPVMVVHSIDTILDDPHLADVGFFNVVDHPSEGRIRTTSVPSKWSKSSPRPRVGAPGLGEHSREILGEAGLDAAAIDRLISDAIVRAADRGAA